MTDKELFELCRKYGSNALMWRRKFEALLHEVNKRKLYLRHSCHSIFEFAAKYGGVSNKTVAEILRLQPKIADKPLLRAEIAIHGWSKVRAVAPLIATEKEEDLVDMVRTMPRRAIEKTVQHLKAQQLCAQLGAQPDAQPGARPGPQSASQPPTQNQDPQPQAALTGCNFEITQAAQITHAARPAHLSTKTKMTFDVDAETELRLRQFKQNLEKTKKRPVSFNEVLKELLNSRCETQPISKKKRLDAATPTQTPNQKCSISSCNRPATENHHPTRQALEKNKKTVPLCRTHHQVAHSGRIKNEHAAPETWLATATPNRTTAAYRIDKKVQAHWQRC